MKTRKPGTLLLLTIVLAASCSSSTLTRPAHDSGTPVPTPQDSGLDMRPDAPPQQQGCGIAQAGEVPSEHRAVATACAPSTRSPAVPDAGLLSCTTSADCAGDAAPVTLFATCLHGQCSFDRCLADSDCDANEVCVCANDYYGGNAAYHPNVCVPANCHVDSDCGADGFCSPSRGTCGSYNGYYCHTAHDTCVDPTRDCADCGGAGATCVYTPTTGAFVCGAGACGG